MLILPFKRDNFIQMTRFLFGSKTALIQVFGNHFVNFVWGSHLWRLSCVNQILFRTNNLENDPFWHVFSTEEKPELCIEYEWINSRCWTFNKNLFQTWSAEKRAETFQRLVYLTRFSRRRILAFISWPRQTKVNTSLQTHNNLNLDSRALLLIF